MSELIRVETTYGYANATTQAEVTYAPNNSRVIGQWGSYWRNNTALVVVDAYTTPANDGRRKGTATRLAQSLIRYALLAEPRIAQVEAYCTIPHSIKIMQRLFPNGITIYNGAEEQRNVVPPSAVPDIMKSWGDIPEDTLERHSDHGLTVIGSLAGVDVSTWEMPVGLSIINDCPITATEAKQSFESSQQDVEHQPKYNT
ncbi:MAG TPA: hypothetical protein VLE73_05795 [Candidatus Saccharimonadales bacterium]|nr:hypothetical protein [Candidatus Saccharimonadales bacterium]